MKNVCVLLRKNMQTMLGRQENAILSAFQSGGYTFHEVRILLEDEPRDLSHLVENLKEEYQNILLLADNHALNNLNSYCSGVLHNALKHAEYDDACIFEWEKNLLCLISSDEKGAEYASKVALPFFSKKYGLKFDKVTIRFVGASYGLVRKLLEDVVVFSHRKVSYRHTRKYDEDVVELLYDSNTPKMLIDDVLRLFVDGIGDCLYALEDTTLECQLVTLLKLRGKKLSVAESFTGGGIARRIVSVPGASEVYFEGLNTYNELSKMKRLGVSSYTLGKEGAVSEKTAYEMALGLLNTGDCELAIATTGLAGPSGDAFGHPVGHACIAVGTKERIFVYQYRFNGEREEITEKAINYALFLAYKRLKEI